MFYGDVLRTCKLMLVSIAILEIFEKIVLRGVFIHSTVEFNEATWSDNEEVH